MKRELKKSYTIEREFLSKISTEELLCRIIQSHIRKEHLAPASECPITNKHAIEGRQFLGK